MQALPENSLHLFKDRKMNEHEPEDRRRVDPESNTSNPRDGSAFFLDEMQLTVAPNNLAKTTYEAQH